MLSLRTRSLCISAPLVLAASGCLAKADLGPAAGPSALAAALAEPTVYVPAASPNAKIGHLWQGFGISWTYNHRINRMGFMVNGPDVKNPGVVPVTFGAASGTGPDAASVAGKVALVDADDTEFAYQTTTLQIRGSKAKEHTLRRKQDVRDCEDVKLWDAPPRGEQVAAINGFDVQSLDKADSLLNLAINVVSGTRCNGDADPRYASVHGSMRARCASAECSLPYNGCDQEHPGNDTDFDIQVAVVGIAGGVHDIPMAIANPEATAHDPSRYLANIPIPVPPDRRTFGDRNRPLFVDNDWERRWVQPTVEEDQYAACLAADAVQSCEQAWVRAGWSQCCAAADGGWPAGGPAACPEVHWDRSVVLISGFEVGVHDIDHEYDALHLVQFGIEPRHWLSARPESPKQTSSIGAMLHFRNSNAAKFWLAYREPGHAEWVANLHVVTFEHATIAQASVDQTIVWAGKDAPLSDAGERSSYIRYQILPAP